MISGRLRPEGYTGRYVPRPFSGGAMNDIPETALHEIITASRSVEDLRRKRKSSKGVADEGVPIELPSVAARRDRHFIPPLPVRLFAALAPLPGKALAVYMVLWRRSRMERSPTVLCTSASWQQCGLTRRQKALALACLEDYGLVTVEHRQGKSPR